MAKIPYEALLNMYNTSVTRVKVLEADQVEKAEALKKYEAEMDVIIDHTRKLCEKILAKDRSEMTLGSARSWASTPTLQLIDNATDSFDNYVRQNTDLIKRIFDISEQRGRQVDDLKDQIATMITGGNIAASSVEEVIESAERRSRENDARVKAAPALQKAAAEGKIELILEEDGDVTEEEQELLDAMAEQAAAIQLTPKAVPLKTSGAKSKAMKRAEDKATQLHMVDLKKYEDKLSDDDWEFIDAIAVKGLSRFSEISSYLVNEKGHLKSMPRNSGMILENSGILETANISLPTKASATKFLWLSDMGKRLFKTKYGKDPVLCEIEIIKAEHDNPEHGYGIISLGQILEESGKYTRVSTSNRDNPIPVVVGGEKHYYVPDVIAVTPKFTEYYEYERDTHNQKNFNLKCNKMVKVTRFLYFITPNKSIAKNLKKKIDKWIETKTDEEIKGVVVRIGTVLSIKEGKWCAEYRLAKNREPEFSTL